jgi:anti-sigma B factor antagonist
MKFSEKYQGTVLLLEIEEARLEAINAPELRELLIGRIENGDHQIVLDLKLVNFMDSSALGALIGAIKKMGPLGTLALAGATGPVLQLLKLTRMDKVFPLYTSAAAALTKLEE